MGIKFNHGFKNIIGINNLLEAWKEFIKGKKNKKDVQIFSLNLMDNILLLNCDLANNKYKHGKYQCFNICDPRPRIIHKASVRDRLVHHTIYRKLYPFFDKIFISDSYSCRINKGTHKAINRFCSFGYKVSQNNTKTCWVLKCDIKKFFASIDHKILIQILQKYILRKNIFHLLQEIIKSFKPGLPLGNLTSQLFVNIYMNKFDKFIKHNLKIKYYIRYCDDFVIFSRNRNYLEKQVILIKKFLKNKLKLDLPDNKAIISTLYSGVDFLGWVHFPDHRVLRTKTKKRMFKKIKINNSLETLNSYLGLLKHGNTYKLKQLILREKSVNI